MRHQPIANRSGTRPFTPILERFRGNRHFSEGLVCGIEQHQAGAGAAAPSGVHKLTDDEEFAIRRHLQILR